MYYFVIIYMKIFYRIEFYNVHLSDIYFFLSASQTTIQFINTV